MKATLIASLAMACLALGSLPATALDVGVGVSGSAGVSLGGSGGSASAAASVGASANASGGGETAGAGGEAELSLASTLSAEDEIAVVIRLIETSNWSSSSLSGVTEVSATVYDVGPWLNAENQAAFESAISAHAEEIADLQAALSANASLSAALEASNAEASGVVTVGIAADGSLAIFTQ